MSARAGGTAWWTAVALIGIGACGRSPGGNGTGSGAQSPGSAAPPPAVRHDDRVFAGGVAPAALGFQNPDAGNARSAEEGGALFSSMNCDGCHGGGAVGFVGPSLSDGRWRYGGSDPEIFHSIYYGQPHGMPAYGGVLQPALIWKIVVYIRSLPPPEDVPTERW